MDDENELSAEQGFGHVSVSSELILETNSIQLQIFPIASCAEREFKHIADFYRGNEGLE